MKYFVALFVFFSLIFVSLAMSSFYELDEYDYSIIDTTEERVFEYLDTHLEVQPEHIVSYIEYLLKTQELSARATTILETIQDDIAYAYYLWVYEYDTRDREYCYEDEYFDENDQRCYLSDDYVYDTTSDFSQEKVHKWEGLYDEESFVAVYNISGNTLQLNRGNKNSIWEEIWSIFTTLIPERNREDFKLYRLIDDSAGDTGAYVEQDMSDPALWNLTVNLDAFIFDGELDEEYMISTLIHEYAHVLSLNASQVRYYPVTDNENILDRFAQNCENQLVGEGCLYADAYLDDFIDIFWSDEQELERVRAEELDVYRGNEDNFISEYAATNPAEDIAESFTYFVLKPTPSGNSGADKKLRFFYNYKELENLRKLIRSWLDTL